MITRHPDTALVPYVRGELTGEEGARVARHLEGCASCREAADSAAAAMRELALRVEAVPAPDAAIYRAELYRKLNARAEAGVRGNAGARWRQPRIVGFSLGGFVAAAAALMLIFVTHRGAWVAALPQVAVPPMDQLATQAGTMQEAAMTGADVGLLRDYAMVERLDLLENYDVIAHLDQVSPAAPANDENRS
jgi:anti-sigma factor RsiW